MFLWFVTCDDDVDFTSMNFAPNFLDTQKKLIVGIFVAVAMIIWIFVPKNYLRLGDI